MPSRRDAIRLTPEEQREFLASGKTLYLASNGKDGFPHIVAMWYGLDRDDVVMTTYRKSQKVLNLRRDPRCALILEQGETYDRLKGLLLRGRCEVIDDEETTLATLAEVGRRFGGLAHPSRQDMEAMRPQARKRVTLRFRAEKAASWDHRKLGGAY
jgi:PPOX class probable F420-dependent enzyme